MKTKAKNTCRRQCLNVSRQWRVYARIVCLFDWRNPSFVSVWQRFRSLSTHNGVTRHFYGLDDPDASEKSCRQMNHVQVLVIKRNSAERKKKDEMKTGLMCVSVMYMSKNFIRSFHFDVISSSGPQCSNIKCAESSPLNSMTRMIECALIKTKNEICGFPFIFDFLLFPRRRRFVFLQAKRRYAALSNG